MLLWSVASSAAKISFFSYFTGAKIEPSNWATTKEVWGTLSYLKNFIIMGMGNIMCSFFVKAKMFRKKYYIIIWLS